MAEQERAPGTSNVRTGAEPRDGDFGRRVLWIDWDSGLRGSGLRVGDHVTGDHGEPYTAETDRQGEALGAHGEDRRWRRLGLFADDALAVTVVRGSETVTLSGRLTANRSHRNAAGLRTFGEGGPVQSDKDGFTYAWAAWYDTFQRLAETVLAGWDYTLGYDTRRLAKEIEEHRERVGFLERTYPGAFARAVRDDFGAMERILAGERREVSAADLEYRNLGAKRAADVAAAADAAWPAFLAELPQGLVVEPFPAPTKPFEEDLTGFVGKIVKLPEIGDREILLESKRSWFQIGRSQGVYLIARQADAVKPLFAATDRYIEKVNPSFGRRRIAFVGTVEPLPALVSDVVRNVTLVGLRVTPLAALVVSADEPAQRFFVDMRPERTGGEAFAGEAQLLAVGRPRLAPEMSPQDVLRTFFDSLKAGDFETFRACFATWLVRDWFEGDGSFRYVDSTWTTANDQDAISLFDRSRKRLLDDVYGLEVAEVSPARVVFDAAQQPGKISFEPRTVEEVRILVDHVGRFGEEFRTFAGGDLHRKWTLQRLDDGPWRIVGAQPI